MPAHTSIKERKSLYSDPKPLVLSHLPRKYPVC